MRDSFVSALIELADCDSDLILVTGDVGFGIFDEFIRRFPDQFINVGIAEQNMVGVAAGLAVSGKKVFVYSIANFATFRCLEQIRNDVCYHNLNVTIVASGGGFTYGQLGMSHHATEDLAVMCAIPNITVVAPCSAWEAALATKELYLQESAGYLRLEKGGENQQPHHLKFQLGKAMRLEEGQDITIVCTGGITEEVMRATKRLKNQGVSAEVIAVHTLKPFDRLTVTRSASKTGAVLTVEEHTVIGGLGSAVADVVASQSRPIKFNKLGIEDVFCSTVGDQKFLRNEVGVSESRIASAAAKLVKK